MKIVLSPVAFVQNSRKEPVDDNWNSIISEIQLAEHIPDEALLNLDTFSHLEIIYFFNLVKDEDIVYAGRPRGKAAYPLTGIFGQRKKDRPNKLGACIVELISINKRTVTVRKLDAIDGTPVLDIKPVFKEFMPAGEIKQPAWVSNLMKEYW